MILLSIVAATLAAGIGSVWVADGLLRLGLGGRWRVGPQQLLSLAAGALMATAFMHLLPEAFESGVEPHDLFAILLLGLVFFFVLERPSYGTTPMKTPPTMPMLPGTPTSTTTTIITTTTTVKAVGRCSPATACTALATGC